MHLSVLLFGFTAIIGRAITLNATPLVWWRVIIVVMFLSLFPATRKGLRALNARQFFNYFTIGIVLCLHWLCFYGSVKYANASVAATTIALASVMVAFAEPLFFRQRIKLTEILLGLLIVPGMILIVGGTPDRMAFGLFLGVLSAVFVGVVAILNKRFIHDSDPLTMTWIEMAAALLFISVLSPLLPTSESAFVLPNQHDFILLMLLAILCTALPFFLTFKAMRHVTAFGSLLAINLEPVYTVVLGIVFFGEQHELTGRFYLGVLLVLVTVLVYPFLRSHDWQSPPSSAAS